MRNPAAPTSLSPFFSFRHPKRLQKRLLLVTFLTFLSLTILDTFLPTTTNTLIRNLSHLSFRIANNIADVATPVQYADTAVYWHIHKAGGTSMKRYYSCMGLVEASQMGVLEGHDNDKILKVWEDQNGDKYVNVDTTKEVGILRAKTLKLAERHLADVVFVTFPALATHVFGQEYKGRFFTLFRHPIERTVSEFYYRQIASWEPKYDPTLKDKTIEEWLRDDEAEAEHNGNFMTAKLVGKSAADLTMADLQSAKEFLRTKFLVGLVSEMEESVDRFDTYFHWTTKPNRQECIAQFVKTAANQNNHQGVPSGSVAWDLLKEKNEYDLMLYRYAVELFEEQRALFPNLPLSFEEEVSQPPPPVVVQEEEHQATMDGQPEPDSAVILQLAEAAYDNVPIPPQQEQQQPILDQQQQKPQPNLQQQQEENAPPSVIQQTEAPPPQEMLLQEDEQQQLTPEDNVVMLPQEQQQQVPQEQQPSNNNVPPVQQQEQQEAFEGAYENVPIPQEDEEEIMEIPSQESIEEQQQQQQQEEQIPPLEIMEELPLVEEENNVEPMVESTTS